MKKLVALSLLLFAMSCIQEPDFETPIVETENFTDFNFSTVNAVSVNLEFKDSQGNPLNGVKIQLINPADGTVVVAGFTNAEGFYGDQIQLASYISEVVLEANYIGIPNSIGLPVKSNSIELQYLGKVDPSQVIEINSTASQVSPQGVRSTVNASNSLNATPPIVYMGSYNSSGVPSYKEPQRDAISATLLAYINASLPESQPVPQFHPTYIANGKKTTLDIIELADVWITFVHEGAGWRNAIGFYTYPTATPPQSLADINQVNVAFPNLSFSGSGGGLVTGDKINLGRFQPGTSLGVVLLANGWDGTNSESFYHMVFADKKLNPESDDELKQHNVLLWDAENELFLLGFEDVRRDDIPFQSDQDFNDAILFVTSNPVRAISTENVNPVDKPGTLDKDGDGINDILDEYPDDESKAYNSYYPSSTIYGTFAFEDNWPEMGDYDFNDLVVDYQFKHVMNASNKVVSMEPKFVVRAAGAGYRNGFGFALNLLPQDVSNASGAVLNSGIIKTNPNGTESNQSKAVFVVSDNVHDLFSTGGFINTQITDAFFEPVAVTLDIQLSSPKTLNELGSVPYNPFIIISQNRGREAHLPGYAPTDLVDESFFGTADDNSNKATGSYYKSKTSLPWAIHLPESFAYPMEKADIRDAHLRFKDWASSFGYSYMDWYRDQSSYRNTNKIFRSSN
jgi:LruC domain-containing protein